MARMTNRYEGRCHYCGDDVPAEGGVCWRFGSRWYVAHAGCMDGRRDEIKRLKREAKAQGYGRERWRDFERDLREAYGLSRTASIPEAAFRGVAPERVARPAPAPESAQARVPDFAADVARDLAEAEAEAEPQRRADCACNRTGGGVCLDCGAPVEPAPADRPAPAPAPSRTRQRKASRAESSIARLAPTLASMVRSVAP